MQFGKISSGNEKLKQKGTPQILTDPTDLIIRVYFIEAWYTT